MSRTALRKCKGFFYKIVMKEQSYFPHYSQQKDSIECTLLIDQLGLEGYGIFWVLMETLRAEELFKYPIKLIPSLARKYGTSKEKMFTVVNNYNLFTIIDDEFFYSKELNQVMFEIAEKKLKYSKAGQKGMLNRWKNNNNVITSLSENNNNVITSLSENNNNVITELLHSYSNDITSKVNKSKVNKSKVNKSKVNIPPDFLEFKNYALENENNIDLKKLENKYKGWIENGWKDGYNKKITNWKTKLLNTIPYLLIENSNNYANNTNSNNENNEPISELRRQYNEKLARIESGELVINQG